MIDDQQTCQLPPSMFVDPTLGINIGRVEAVGKMPITLNCTMAKVFLLEE